MVDVPVGEKDRIDAADTVERCLRPRLGPAPEVEQQPRAPGLDQHGRRTLGEQPGKDPHPAHPALLALAPRRRLVPPPDRDRSRRNGRVGRSASSSVSARMSRRAGCPKELALNTDALLRALRDGLAEAGTPSLAAERVRELGAAVGLGDAELVQWIDALAEQGFLRKRWGGKVELTEKAEARLAGPPAPPVNVQAGENAIVVVQSRDAVAGHGAIGPEAVVVQPPARPGRVDEATRRPTEAGEEKPRRRGLLARIKSVAEGIVWLDKVRTAVQGLLRWFGLGP
jgi:hypothetical protein